MPASDTSARRRALRRLRAPLAVATLAVLACDRVAPARGAERSSADTRPAASPTDSMTADSLRLRLDLPDEVALGAPVPIGVRVENASARMLTLYVRGRTPTFDVHVTGERGDTVWHRLEGEIIPAVVQLRELAPGEALVLADTWPQRTNRGASVPAGRYVVRATLLTDAPDGIAFPPATLRIGAR